MKKILIAGALLAGFAAFAADDKLNDIKPESGKAVEAPTGAEWHNANDKSLRLRRPTRRWRRLSPIHRAPRSFWPRSRALTEPIR